jgi:hypothetical protein
VLDEPPSESLPDAEQPAASVRRNTIAAFAWNVDGYMAADKYSFFAGAIPTKR